MWEQVHAFLACEHENPAVVGLFMAVECILLLLEGRLVALGMAGLQLTRADEARRSA